MELNTLSISGLVKLFNAAVENHELPVKPVAKFGSKAAGITRVEKLIADYALTLEQVNDELALTRVSHSEDQANDEAEGDEAEGDAANDEGEGDAPVAKPAGKRRGPTPEYTDEMIVELLVENPKRIGSKARARFAGYVNGMTIAEALAAGLNRDDFRWDTFHGFINITSPDAYEAESEAEPEGDESPAEAQDETPAPEAEDNHDQAA